MEEIYNHSDNKDKYFKGQQKNEHFICFFRHHWVDLLREFLYFSLFMGVIFFTIAEIEPIKDIMRGNRELKLLFITGWMIATVYLHHFFIKFLNWFVNIGIITDVRIIDHQKSLYFRDTLDVIDMVQIQNIEKIEQGIWPDLLKYGDIKIYLTASNTVKIFHRVPNAKFHFRCINRQKEARQSLLFKEREQKGFKVPEMPGITLPRPQNQPQNQPQNSPNNPDKTENIEIPINS